MKRVIAIAVVVLTTAGCGSSPVVPIWGRVTLDGRPLPNAIVYFQPIGDHKPNAGMGSAAKTDLDGHYTLRQIQPDRPGAVVSRHRVTIRAAPESGAKEDAPLKNPFPKYEQEIEVPPGGGQFDFQLSSGSGKRGG
jgi:hypothetical protein